MSDADHSNMRPDTTLEEQVPIDDSSGVDQSSSEVGRSVELRASSIATSYSGPLPPAQQFAAYEETLPGSANRILVVTELAAQTDREVQTRALGLQEHELTLNHEQEMSRIRGANRYVISSLLVTGFVSLAAIGAACLFAVLGYQGPAAIVGIGPVVAVLLSALFGILRRPQTSTEELQATEDLST